MKFSQKKRKNLPLILAFLCLAVFGSSYDPAWADDGTSLQDMVTGIVTDGNTKEALPGVSIVIKGTTRGTITDLNGAYSIEASPEDILLFSYIGFSSQEIPVGIQKVINVELASEAIGLNEVVFIGYGHQKKSDLTGSVASVSEDMIKAQPLSSIDQALQGKAAGVIVQQSSGSPAGGVSVLIRGAGSINASTQPLYVVDGVVISNSSTSEIASIDGGQGGQASNPLASLNYNDIESIEIMKDASSTAIYGARGANGIVFITTKRGKEGQNNLSFSAYYGFQQLPKKLDVLSSEEYARYQLIQTVHNNNVQTFPDFEVLLDVNDNQLPFTTLDPDSFTVNTNWQDEMYRTAPMRDYYLSSFGGTEKVRYSLSGGYNDVEGILIGSSYRRFSLRANTDVKMTKWFEMGNSALFSYSKEDMTFNDAYYGGGMVERALQQRPDMAVRDSAGNFAGPDANMEEESDNPIAAELEKQNDNVTTRIIGNIYGQLNIVKGLTLKSVFGTDISNGRTTLFNPSVDRGPIYVENARMLDAIKQNLNWSWESYLTYNLKIRSTDLTFMAGSSLTYTKWDQFQAYRDDFPSNDSRNIALGSEANMRNAAYAGIITGKSQFFRFIYSFRDLIVFRSDLRRELTSSFKKVGYFPAFAVAYKLSNHSFMESLPFISFAKLRLGYGETGNANVTGIPYLPQLQSVLVSFHDQIYPAYQPAGKDNPYIQWETIKTVNVGLDLNFIKNRFQFTTDVYWKKSEGMLIRLPLSVMTAPFGDPWSNSGDMINKGIELNLVSRNIVSKFNWSTSVVYSFNRNIILNLKETDIDQNVTTQDPMITRTSEDYSIAQFYGFVTDGIFKSQEEIDEHAFQNRRTTVGDIRFKDLNGDGVIDDNDKTYLGSPLPTHTFGLSNDFSYAGFDLSIFIQGQQGNKVLNWTRRRMESLSGTSNQFPTVLDAYNPHDIYLETPYGDFLVAPENTNTDMPRMTTADNNNNRRISDRYIEDASFLKIQTVTFGYTIPEKITSKIKASRLRVYVTGKNLYTFTRYSGYEPEHGPLNNNPLLTGIDIGNYPIPRSVIFGLNLDF